MASVKELLVNTLSDLQDCKLKECKWLLINNHDGISRSEMEKADRLDTVDKMVSCFGPEEAVKITVNVLRKMNQNYLAEELERKHKRDRLESVGAEERTPCLKNNADKAKFFDDHWPDLIKKVKNVGIIADKLLQLKMINEEQYSEITRDHSVCQVNMRKICDVIRPHGVGGKAKFISILQEEESFLLDHWFDPPLY